MRSNCPKTSLEILAMEMSQIQVPAHFDEILPLIDFSLIALAPLAFNLFWILAVVPILLMHIPVLA